MKPITIDVATQFSNILVKRNFTHGTGRNNGKDFRERFLKHLDNPVVWNNPDTAVILDFKQVTIIGPAWANEAFAYFRKYADKATILSKIQLVNISRVKQAVIELEIGIGYKG